MSGDAAIRWDVFEEHLEEAAFLHQLWEEALRSPLYALHEIAAGPEERMLAHVDGLVVAGRKVAERLLLPALSSDEAGVAFAAALALALAEDGDFLEPILEALGKAEPGPRAALRRALSIAPVPGLGPRLAALAPRSAPALQVDLLEVLATLRVDPGIRLEPLAASREPGAEARALRIARAFPQRLDAQVIARALSSPDGETRAAAIETASITGARGARAAAEESVAARGPAFPRAALVLALAGDEKAVGALAPALGDEKVRSAAAFALGFTGRVSAADALLDAVKVEALAPVAAEGFAAIAGVAVEKRFARVPPRWRPLPPGAKEDEEEERYGPEADLPEPVPETLARWWAEARPGLDPAVRWLRGRPYGVAALARELEEGPARRREGLALDVAIRTRGGVLLAWDALAARQRKELSAVEGIPSPAAPPPHR